MIKTTWCGLSNLQGKDEWCKHKAVWTATFVETSDRNFQGCTMDICESHRKLDVGGK